MADMDTYDDDAQGYEGGNYARNRSRSPVRERDDDTRAPEEPANGRAERDHAPERNGGGGSGTGGEAQNQGSNLFVTGIHPRLDETEVTRLFERYGEVEKCNIMKDPHTAESRGFGFVKMLNAEDAASAKQALSGFAVEGRTLSIEFARRSRPRTPTPGKYYGPPKRDDRPPRGGFRDDRGYGRRDDRRGGGGGYRDRYDDRGYSRRDDYAPRGGDRDRGDRDRYRSDRYDDRGSRSYGGGGGGGSYDRAERGDRAERAPRGPPADSYGGDSHARDAPPRDGYERRGY